MSTTLAPPPTKHDHHRKRGDNDREHMIHRAHHACNPNKALCGAPLPDAKKYPHETRVDCVVCEAMKNGRCPYCGVQFS